MYLICIEQPNWSERYLFQNKQNAVNFLKDELIPDLEPNIDHAEIEDYARMILRGDEQGVWMEEIDVMDA